MGRDVNRAVLARFITNAGAEASFFIGLWGKAAYQFGAGATALAIMAVMIMASSVVGNVTGGVIVDRTDARRVLIASEVALVPAVLLLITANSLTSLFAIGAVVFLLHGIEETAATSLPPAMIEEGDDAALVAVNARLESAGWLAMVAGPGVGGALAGLVNLNAVFVFDAATSVVSIALLVTVHLARRPVKDPDEDAATGLAEVLAGLAVARRTPPILLAMAVGGTLWFAFGAFVSLEPLYYRDILKQGPEVIGYVNAVFGVGLFAGSTIVGRWGRRFGFTQAVWLAAATGLGATVYVGSSSIWIAVCGAVLWAIPLGMIFPIVRTLAQRSAPEGMVGRVMGTIATAQNLMSVLPAAFVPFLAAEFGVQPVLIGGALVPVMALPFLLRAARHMDQVVPITEDLEFTPDTHPTPTPLP